jgi:hypothetical protein
MYYDEAENKCTYDAFSYMNNSWSEGGKYGKGDGHKWPPKEDGTWTGDHITLDQLLTWVLAGGAAHV